MIRPILYPALIGAAAMALAACGRQGDLDRPTPLVFWNAKEKAAYEQQKRDQADAASNQAQTGRRDTPPDQGPGYDPNENPAPPRTQPMQQNLPPDPGGAAPQGVIPDPYNHPQTP